MLDGEEREEKGQNEVDFSFLKGDNLENNLDNNLEDNLENKQKDNLDNNTLEAAAVKESDSYSIQVYTILFSFPFWDLTKFWLTLFVQKADQVFGEEEEYSNKLQQDNLEDYNLETVAVKGAPKLRLLLFVFGMLAFELLLYQVGSWSWRGNRGG